MTGTLHRRLWVMSGAAVAAVVAWWAVPGTSTDHAAFVAVARSFANPPFFISGNGSHAAPWQLRTVAATNLTDRRQTPVIVSLGDDGEGFFQSSPPSPIDLAVILTNFQRLGVAKAATGVVLAWDVPDPIGLAALDKAISRFDSLVMTAPLSRGAVPEPLPPAFRKASLSLDSLHGDSSYLPIVNRIPLPGVILGGANTLAGFQVLDSEPAGKFAPLLARWGDRVVFSFPLLCALQRLDLTVEGVSVTLGESIKLSPHGPIVPIDRYGRLAMPLKTLPPYAEIPAAALIDGTAALFPSHAPLPVVLRDDRSAAEPATRAFSQKLPTLIAALAADQGLAPPRNYHRLAPAWELAGLIVVALILAKLCAWPAFARNTGLLTTAGVCLSTQFIAAAWAGLWLPGMAALAAIACAAVLARVIAVTPAVPLLDPAPATARPPRRLAKPTPQLAPSLTAATPTSAIITPVPRPEPGIPAPPPAPPTTPINPVHKPRPAKKKRRR